MAFSAQPNTPTTGKLQVASTHSASTQTVVDIISNAAEWAYNERRLPPAFLDANGEPTIAWGALTDIQKGQIWDYAVLQTTLYWKRLNIERKERAQAELDAASAASGLEFD